MSFKHHFAAIICLAAIAVALPVHSATLGVAAEYNVFVFHGFNSSGGHTQGNLAAGGNVTFTGSYAVADEIGDGSARLVSGNTFSTTGSGSVGPNGNGTIYAASASYPQYSFNVLGGVATPPDQGYFTDAETYFQNLSTSWRDLTSGLTPATPIVDGGNVSLTLSGDQSLNVFSVLGSDLSNVIGLTINAPADSTVLINVSGSVQNFRDGMVFLEGGIDPSHIIYNFFEATEMGLNGGKNMMGSILAPWADVTGGWGALDGQLIAQSFSGNTEFHNQLFVGTVPLPAAFWLFGPAFGFLSVLSRCRRQTS